uniref:Uncharacterized protein n=1 Tax=Zea mays TaxID=4577 RepID=C0PL45_MAIZE|nr:unknown [Zea mays]
MLYHPCRNGYTIRQKCIQQVIIYLAFIQPKAAGSLAVNFLTNPRS